MIFPPCLPPPYFIIFMRMVGFALKIDAVSKERGK